MRTYSLDPNFKPVIKYVVTRGDERLEFDKFWKMVSEMLEDGEVEDTMDKMMIRDNFQFYHNEDFVWDYYYDNIGDVLFECGWKLTEVIVSE